MRRLTFLPRLALLLTFGALAGGCVVSETPVSGLGERSTLFPPGIRYEVFQRTDEASPWRPAERPETLLVAGANGIYKHDDGPNSGVIGYSFFHLGPNRYIAEAQFDDKRYAYGLLEIRGNEALIAPFDCNRVTMEEQAEFAIAPRLGDCWLDTSPDPAGFLRRLAERPSPHLIKYVPVSK